MRHLARLGSSRAPRLVLPRRGCRHLWFVSLDAADVTAWGGAEPSVRVPETGLHAHRANRFGRTPERVSEKVADEGGGDGGGVSTLHQLDSSDLFFSVAQELPAYVAHVAFIVGVSYLLERKDKNEFKKHLADVNTIARGAQESERRAHRRRWTVAPR